MNSVFTELDIKRNKILQKLQSSENNTVNVFNIDKVNVNCIFHITQIKKICFDYRLRFLDTKYFKGDYPEEVITKTHSLEQEHNTKLDGFKIVAPSVLFKLKKADDPILFAPMGNDYYYLIHKWGNDLHPLRRIKFWAIKNVKNFAFFSLLISLFITIVTHKFFFREHTNFMYCVILFLFHFKGVIAFGLSIGIASGKNFSEWSWNSKYDKVT